MTPDELIDWRERFNLSRSELALRLGVATPTVWRWETGKSPVPPFLRLTLESLGREIAPSVHSQAPYGLRAGLSG